MSRRSQRFTNNLGKLQTTMQPVWAKCFSKQSKDELESGLTWLEFDLSEIVNAQSQAVTINE
ncbi:MAG: hypothetical protein EA001_00810 [Oscillatoriales cyanobacterium]|nr:MAG: hypothetical protein EA001_00810 [Oscillatoriales cyanobacterium]